MKNIDNTYVVNLIKENNTKEAIEVLNKITSNEQNSVDCVEYQNYLENIVYTSIAYKNKNLCEYIKEFMNLFHPDSIFNTIGYNADIDFIEYLIIQGLDLNDPCISYEILEGAINASNKELISYLLKKISLDDYMKDNALSNIIQNDKTLLKFFNFKEQEIIVEAIKKDNVEVLKDSYKKNPDIFKICPQAFNISCENNSINSIKFLLDHGVSAFQLLDSQALNNLIDLKQKMENLSIELYESFIVSRHQQILNENIKDISLKLFITYAKKEADINLSLDLNEKAEKIYDDLKNLEKEFSLILKIYENPLFLVKSAHFHYEEIIIILLDRNITLSDFAKIEYFKHYQILIQNILNEHLKQLNAETLLNRALYYDRLDIVKYFIDNGLKALPDMNFNVSHASKQWVTNYWNKNKLKEKLECDLSDHLVKKEIIKI